MDDDDSANDDDDSAAGDDDDSVADDLDGDGFSVEEDCDDADPSIYPLAGDDYGDGIDSDCDGLDCEAATHGLTYFTACPASVLRSDGATACAAAGHDGLASLLSAEEQAFVEALRPTPPTTGYWIGFNDIATDGDYVWDSGLPVTYTNWYAVTEPTGQPSTDEDCVHFFGGSLGAGAANGMWNDNFCSVALQAYFCESRQCAVVEDCGDGLDNDCDGDVDGADGDCAGDDDDSVGDDDDSAGPQDLDVQGMTFISLPGGSFDMGCTSAQQANGACQPDESPVHSVTLTNDFWMAETEVTQGQWEALMGSNPSYNGPNGGGPACGDECPVQTVNWYESLALANAVSFAEGLPACYALGGCAGVLGSGCGSAGSCNSATAYTCGSVTVNTASGSPYECEGFRLPTEAEWEYAARAGTDLLYAGSDTIDDVGWYSGNGDDAAHPVGGVAENAWGLYDMSGNVWEWTWDWYDDSYYAVSPSGDPEGPATGSVRVFRGGGVPWDAAAARVARRQGGDLFHRSRSIGLRLARTLP